MPDFIVVGAGISGATIAERIANELDKEVLVIEKRSHVGGNCYDYVDEAGICVQKYGPHIFHTNDKRAYDYVSQFTNMLYYENKVVGFVDGKFVPIPFNFYSLHLLFPIDTALRIEEKAKRIFGENKRISFSDMYKVNDKDFSLLADYIFNRVFLHYTEKQWRTPIGKLNPSILQRVPCFVTSYENKYFDDKYQGLPDDGYTTMVNRMLSSSNVELVLNTDAKDFLKVDTLNKKIYFDGTEFHGTLVYSGSADELFNYCFSKLPYRSVDFVLETLNRTYFQSNAIVNYPNNYDFTRITEFKYFYPGDTDKTTIMREYPKDYKKETDIPCYPVITDENTSIFNKYNELASSFGNIILLGRLGSFEYLNMDSAIIKALDIFKRRISGE